MTQRTKSEQLFEQRLIDDGHFFSFEPQYEGKGKRPDFEVDWEATKILFEVKERSPTPCVESPRGIDPYVGIKEEIHGATRKFKEFRGCCCNLVIYNNGDWNTPLRSLHIFGAMLGKPGLQFQLEEQPALEEQPVKAQHVFSPHGGRNGGRMIRSTEGRFQNRRISSIIALKEERIAPKEFDEQVEFEQKSEQNKLSRPLSADEQGRIVTKVFMRDRPQFQTVVKCVVCEHPNPYIPLPRELFRGPFDERYAIVGGQLECVYLGAEVAEAEDFSWFCARE